VHCLGLGLMLLHNVAVMLPHIMARLLITTAYKDCSLLECDAVQSGRSLPVVHSFTLLPEAAFVMV
jgi:hypothetical protein